MNKAIFVGDLVEDNGLTVEQNNLQLKHKIPLGALVEISYDSNYDEPDDDTNGLRLFVVDHSRDCDGTPLYGLSFSRDAKKRLDEIVDDIEKAWTNEDRQFLTFIKWGRQGAILHGYSEDILKEIV